MEGTARAGVAVGARLGLVGGSAGHGAVGADRMTSGPVRPKKTIVDLLQVRG